MTVRCSFTTTREEESFLQGLGDCSTRPLIQVFAKLCKSCQLVMEQVLKTAQTTEDTLTTSLRNNIKI